MKIQDIVELILLFTTISFEAKEYFDAHKSQLLKKMFISDHPCH